jgi:hypothetical protein
LTVKQMFGSLIVIGVGTGLAGGWPRVSAAPQPVAASTATTTCDLEALSQRKSEFQRLVALRPFDPLAVSAGDLRDASAAYIVEAEACYRDLYGPVTETIDDGGLWFTPDGTAPFNLFGTKWGAGTSFGMRINMPGPRIPGGTVSYSYMANGVGLGTHVTDEGSNVAISSLPTYSSCFLFEISGAFAAWSAVADIQFVQVADNGLPFNQSGASGDIRIGAHTFDGGSGTLAHGYFPPPNGASAAGDVHFDRQENWSCVPGSGLIDIGIVAAHEIGHAIGLNHEATLTALMNAFYNPARTMPIADDIDGATNIYGPAVPVTPTPTVTTARDYDGDGRADIAIYRQSTGGWFALRSSNGQLFNVDLGMASQRDRPVPADYDGDGSADAAVFRPTTGEWLILRSSTDTVLQVGWGATPLRDVPVPADYDGDGRVDIAVYRGSTGEWFILRSSDASLLQVSWGAPTLGDMPVPADYDGDGEADIAVYRGTTGQWFILRSANGTLLQVSWGAPSLGDVPVPADYDGDGEVDIAVYRGTSGEWFIRRSTNSTLLQQGWGSPALGDVPVAADYDGDDKADIAVFRSTTGEWFILRSSNGTLLQVGWGAPSLGDVVR